MPLPMTMTAAHVLVSFTARPDAAATFQALMAQVRNDLPAVPGCHAVRVFTQHENPCKVTLLETWASVAAHQAHIAQVVSSGAWDALAAHLSEAPESRYLSEMAN